MKTLVLTGYSDHLMPVAAFTVSKWSEYSKLQGYSFKCVRDFPPELGHPAFQKLRHIALSLPKYDVVLWVDADTLPTNMKIRVVESFLGLLTESLIMSRDWPAGTRRDFPKDGEGSTAAVIFRNTIAAFEILEEAMLLKKEWGNTRNYDQSAIWDTINRHPEYRKHVWLLDRRRLNAVAPECGHAAVEHWQPGDFLVHVGGVDVPKRVAILKKYLSL